MKDTLEFGPATLVMTEGKLQSIEADSRFPKEGKLNRCFVTYRNGDSNMVAQNISDDEELCFPVWIPEMGAIKTLTDAQAENGNV